MEFSCLHIFNIDLGIVRMALIVLLERANESDKLIPRRRKFREISRYRKFL